MGKRLGTYLILVSALFASLHATAQFVDPREAKQYFKNGDYAAAIRVYKRLAKKEPANTEYSHKLGICYLNSNIDKKQAVKYLQKAVQGKNIVKVDPQWYFDLGLAYQYTYKFDDAIKMFNTIKGLVSEAEKKKVINQINCCLSAKELMKYPVNVTFKNLGPKVNTPFPDYYPFVSKSGNQLVFTSRRQGNIGGVKEFDGFYSSDVWIATKAGSGYSSAKNGGVMVNTSMDEQVVGFSDDGQQLFVYVDHIKNYGDIYYSKRRKGSTKFSKIKKFGENINSSKLETSASISADGNTLFFASNRAGGQGGLDLYMSRKLPTGDWALCQNLGSKINTDRNEDFPTLSADGKTLYFCSQGHTNMGGYDVFSSIWNSETNKWSPPKNIGYPINTPLDNMGISFQEGGEYAFLSAHREGGMGDLDIYEVKFNDRSNHLAVYEMYVNSGDTANPHITEAYVEITDKNNTKVGEYVPNPRTGKYLIILPPGNYDITIDSPDYKLLTQDFTVSKKDITSGIIQKEYDLNKRIPK